MRIRPGRTRSLFVGTMMVLVTLIGLVMMGRFGGPGGGIFGPFVIIWILIGLVGAATAFYNAFSREGLPLYEVDMDEHGEGQQGTGQSFCPQCGKPVAEDDQFCRRCGASLEA